MYENDPSITLDIDAMGKTPEGGVNWFYHWAFCINTTGEDGKKYYIDTNIGSYANIGFGTKSFGTLDMWTIALRDEIGKVFDMPGTIFKVCDFPQCETMAWHPFKIGDLKVKKLADKVTVDLPGYHVDCNKDLSWHFNIVDEKQGLEVDVTHRGEGYPYWYGKTAASHFNQHCINRGYFFAAPVDGYVVRNGKKVKIKGAGGRERYMAADLAVAEVGGWMDWIWFHFDEMWGALDEMKYSGHKDGGLYIAEDEKVYACMGNDSDPYTYDTGVSYNVEHHDWAFLPSLGLFIPTFYRVIWETPKGTLDFTCKTVGYKHMAHMAKAPEVPFATLDYEEVEGTFTYKNGRKEKLHNGIAGNQVQQWRKYPDDSIAALGAMTTSLKKIMPDA